MESYRKSITLRIVFFSLAIALFVGILIYNQFFASEALKNSVVIGFQFGFASAGTIVLVFCIVRYRQTLASEEKLRLLYNQEHDERMSAIRSKAGVPMVIVLSVIGVCWHDCRLFQRDCILYA